MFAPQLLELSQMISTFGRSFCDWIPAKISISSASTGMASASSASSGAIRKIRCKRCFMDRSGRMSLAEAHRVGLFHTDRHALAQRHAGARLGVGHCGRDVPFAARAVRVAARLGPSRMLVVLIVAVGRHEALLVPVG